jgi:hypothetical protein
MQVSDILWATAFERALWECLRSGDHPSKATRTASEYANEARKLYLDAMYSGMSQQR